MAHILIVDDDALLLRVLQFWLTEAGYTVTTHTAPPPALAALAGTAYDLLILDLMLPEIDGLQLCRQIRQTATTPILLLSAAPLGVYQAAARAAGPMRAWASRWRRRRCSRRWRPCSGRHPRAGSRPHRERRRTIRLGGPRNRRRTHCCPAGRRSCGAAGKREGR